MYKHTGLLIAIGSRPVRLYCVRKGIHFQEVSVDLFSCSSSLMVRETEKRKFYFILQPAFAKKGEVFSCVCRCVNTISYEFFYLKKLFTYG